LPIDENFAKVCENFTKKIAMTSRYQPAALTLKEGGRFSGFSPSWQKNVAMGEVVFTTGMTGYVESLTDPSYVGQILVFTYPLIGNYGVPDRSLWESQKIHVRGVVISESCENWSHHAGIQSFHDWLKSEGIPYLCGVDTRELTKTLRVRGSTLGQIAPYGKEEIVFYDPNRDHLVAQVSPAQPELIQKKGEKVVYLVDCGAKENIVRMLAEYPITLYRVPHNYDCSNDEYDALFLSNGPGDPMQCAETILMIQKAMAKGKPIYGICLGTQLMALAAGASTYKLPFGHRSHNQPCIELDTGRCYITSQNHGYAIDETTLPEGWKVNFRNLNDQSVEGIAHKTLPFFAVQFHPEASPGPTDTNWIFERFYQTITQQG
jgi:carbamoyl-phosphate synthase small subunit